VTLFKGAVQLLSLLSVGDYHLTPMAALYSNTSGEVYESTIADIHLSIAPATLLPNDHPFCTFFREHLLVLTTPGGSYDALIDAHVAVSTGNPIRCQRASSN
jgi:hypothetical protein